MMIKDSGASANALARLNAQIDLSEKMLRMLSSGPFATIEQAVTRAIHLADALRVARARMAPARSSRQASAPPRAADLAPSEQAATLDRAFGLGNVDQSVHFDSVKVTQTFGAPPDDAASERGSAEAFNTVMDQINRLPRVVVEEGVMQTFGVRKVEG
jgi:hypothetical protein